MSWIQPIDMRYMLILAFWSLFSTEGIGQWEENLDTIRISGTQIPLTIRETGKHITVIQPTQIERLPALSLDELFQTVSGVEVQSRGGFGAQADILMRGSTFTQVLILIDGMRLNDPLTGHFNGNIPVPVKQIERIEVLKGPAAAMYGPDAVGGVINVITKDWFDKHFELNGSAGLGSHTQKTADLTLTLAGDKLSSSASLQYNKSDGELIDEKITTSGEFLEKYRTYFDVLTASFSLTYKMKNNSSLVLRSSYDHRDFNARYFYTSSVFDKSTETTSNSFNVIKYQKIRERSSSDFQIGFKYNTDKFVFSPDFPSTNEHVTQHVNVVKNHLWKISDRTLFKMGWQLDHRQISSNDRGDHDDWHSGIYAMMHFGWEKLNLTGSARLDYDENYDLEFLPQINFSYPLGKILVRGSVGRSIRAADYTERYVSNNLINLTPGRSLGNPDLKAEQSWSEELGADLSVGSRIKIKATGFIRQSSMLIDYVSTNSSQIIGIGDLEEDADYFFAKNISDVSTRGFEIESHLNVPIGLDRSLQVLLGYTHQKTSNQEDIVSVYIANHARDLLTFTSMVTLGNLDLSGTLLHKSRNRRMATAINADLKPAYTVCSVRGTVDVTEKVGIWLQVQNVFNTDYQNILGAPMPGRWFTGSVFWSL